ncbi:nucleoside deaminase [Nocardia sp. NBC_00416]|uniref:nucleoside deaminase n=1 Tax=Nocardia sp. NBC_00416 TaxID=2975991 RepID=UPI002E1F8378
MTITAHDVDHLRRCVELAREALAAGDQPFGSLLVSGDGTVLFEDRNRVRDGDATRHPEFEISRWAANHLDPAGRAAATVYTSGEHCPMCAASHGWVGLGRIVFATSGGQLAGWLREWGAPAAPVAVLPITQIVPGARTEGPVPEFEHEVRALYRDCFAPDTPG